MPDVEARLRKSERIGKNTYMFTGTLTVDTDDSGEVDLNSALANEVGELVSVILSLGMDNSTPVVGHVDENGILTVYQVSDAEAVASETGIEFDFMIIGTKTGFDL